MNGNWKGLITLLSYAYIVGAILKEKNDNPHQPMTLTWQVLSQSGEILFATSKLEPPGGMVANPVFLPPPNHSCSQDYSS